ncbi:MAG TPA: hypothetical protein VF876_03105 [Burkholderiales bacterium]
MEPLAGFAIAGLAMAALALLNGVVSMAHGGEADQHASHLLMFKRVGWQTAAVLAVFFGLLVGYWR